MLEILKKFLRIIFLTNEKEDLLIIRDLVLKFLDEKLKLTVHPRKMILNKIKCGMNFLGYIILTSKKIKVKNNSIKRFNKKIKKYEEEKKFHSLMSFKGHADLADINLINSLAKKNLCNKNYHFFVSANIYKCKKTSFYYESKPRIQAENPSREYEKWQVVFYNLYLIFSLSIFSNQKESSHS